MPGQTVHGTVEIVHDDGMRSRDYVPQAGFVRLENGRIGVFDRFGPLASRWRGFGREEIRLGDRVSATVKDDSKECWQLVDVAPALPPEPSSAWSRLLGRWTPGRPPQRP